MTIQNVILQKQKFMDSKVQWTNFNTHYSTLANV